MNVCSGLRDVFPKVFLNHHHTEEKQMKSNAKKPIQPMSTPGSKVIKVFFMLNSGRHEIFNAHKYKKFHGIQHFQAQVSLKCYFPAHRC